jgi:hypothetical protein
MPDPSRLALFVDAALLLLAVGLGAVAALTAPGKQS